ncbi:conserved Plasmodium protein, unknown function [Plasmodium knowlesi strain H]|uniref:Uncharacterized protein n=3 Tax=Plasmodium knowlesi TaxID=5850 RepID=A0A5K1V7B7_PLAKH|nr:conserved Plasmodium protein, unknown function [Plasmodium knowlesi strain H]OTN65355.1 Uncharacterized protein PKNOH_S110096500 [Plasmodium knowlesi]CAA9989584.1 conserved Plasmodium protein, unknown function [Plasmodium knowlesi strain H]SBO22638.1 conserved Plasmodium protein, unknown function [Plasmodium knowlesi strain H]SBO23411.1 conserved Plasmodium protein, unknown function [Plasmodium knowlesi strain H]VVS79058.1 conserved Plasmodium protein, unknown function [Plasmodium knowlesi |eukprot:XP_002260309.1 hypothetical protein, conserved in Plasmodium species [Plasmodium knowlesi strain H]
MLRKLLLQLIQHRKRKDLVTQGQKRGLVYVIKRRSVLSPHGTQQRTRKIHHSVTVVGYRSRIGCKNDSLFHVGICPSRGSRIIATAQCSQSAESLTQFEVSSEGPAETNSIEKILDETNSMIYVNEICMQMDRSILKCQTYEDILSILITHRGALFLQNLITAIRMLAGFVIEDRKKRKAKGESESDVRIPFRGYTNKFVKAEEGGEKGTGHVTGGNHLEDAPDKREANLPGKPDEGLLSSSNFHLCKSRELSGFDKIEKKLIERYQHIFDVLKNKELLESENFFEKNRKVEEIIVRDERFNLLIDDIYKNRKHFDVVSICHILISLKELNYKHFLLFNSFMNPLKNFDTYIKEQFENGNQKIVQINSVIQLLLQCFNTYIWAGYYNLDIYNRLINTVLLNNFIQLRTEFLHEQVGSYIYMNYKYDVNYPLSSDEIFSSLNLSEKYFSKKNFLTAPLGRVFEEKVKLTGNAPRRGDISVQENKEIYAQNGVVGTSLASALGCMPPSESAPAKERPVYCCPIFLNLDLFLQSIEIYKHVYVYNPSFFKMSEKIVYYYTQYLTPSNFSMIADAFSKHRIFALEHDRFFFHLSKLMEQNFDKFSYKDIFLVLNSFKRMNLLFHRCIVLGAEKFEPYFHQHYIDRRECSLTLKEVSILMESLAFFHFQHKAIEKCITKAVNYLEDYIEEIDEETAINISYALVLSNLYHVNTYFFSFVWRKIGKSTYWEKKKNQVCLLWLSHMIQFKWMEYDLPKFCVLECLKIFFLKRKENMFSFSKILSSVSQILDELDVGHDISVDIYGPYMLDILIRGDKRQVIMLTQDTTRNEIIRQLGDSKIVINHLHLFGYNVRPLNTKYFDTLSYREKREYIRGILLSF